jgi:dihydrodipicolinate synthase/N-acetylneuraminate lyase
MTRLIGPEVPRLWCPPLTHYQSDRRFDVARMTAHWATMAPHVGGFLVPGSTGDGWEMSEGEIAALLEIAIDLATQLDIRVLVGVLRTEIDAMVEVIERTMALLRRKADTEDATEALVRSHVGAFTVCPPAGSALTQAEIGAGLRRVLDLRLPIALYQLPQVTGNEIRPALFLELAAAYPNLLFLKDTSGEDQVPQADCGESGVFLVRGAEGDYASWLRESGGPYDGLLLSTANCFAAELAGMIRTLEDGKSSTAEATSVQLTEAVAAVFGQVEDLPEGNAFTNANKAMDHYMAHGPGAASVAPPVLHAGSRLPEEIIVMTGRILEAAGLMPAVGYLEG